MKAKSSFEAFEKLLSEFRETFKSISNFELTGTYTIYQHNSNQSDHIRNLG